MAGLFMINSKLSERGYWYCGYSQDNLFCSDRCNPAAAKYPICPKGMSCLQDTNNICK